MERLVDPRGVASLGCARLRDRAGDGSHRAWARWFVPARFERAIHRQSDDSGSDCQPRGDSLRQRSVRGGGPPPAASQRTAQSSQQTLSLDLLLDERSLLFALMVTFVCSITSVFAHRYLHREQGYHRYFVLFNLFVVGMLLIGVSGSMALLFAGWEFVGISSALLIAFFQERPKPLQNALRVFTVYRLSDAAMLSAAVIAQQAVGSGRLDLLFLGGDDAVPLSHGTASVIALLLVVAAAGKCAQLPFSGWIPRAMEGPTPSSAVFYGALAIHAGAFMLLRAGPLLEQAPVVEALIIVMAASTALFATVVGRVQTDVKSALAFASLTQVSIILVEIALGLYWIALIHMAGHVLLRLLQFLRAPSVLHDFHATINAVERHGGSRGTLLGRMIPMGVQMPLYRIALERGYLDASIDRVVVHPFVRIATAMDGLERRICSTVERAVRSTSRHLHMSDHQR